jgi:hypothetical protein
MPKNCQKLPKTNEKIAIFFFGGGGGVSHEPSIKGGSVPPQRACQNINTRSSRAKNITHTQQIELLDE